MFKPSGRRVSSNLVDRIGSGAERIRTVEPCAAIDRPVHTEGKSQIFQGHIHITIDLNTFVLIMGTCPRGMRTIEEH